MDSTAKVMEMYSSQKVVLEVEYFGEVGTGLGHTLEVGTVKGPSRWTALGAAIVNSIVQACTWSSKLLVSFVQ